MFNKSEKFGKHECRKIDTFQLWLRCKSGLRIYAGMRRNETDRILNILTFNNEKQLYT